MGLSTLGRTPDSLHLAFEARPHLWRKHADLLLSSGVLARVTQRSGASRQQDTAAAGAVQQQDTCSPAPTPSQNASIIVTDCPHPVSPVLQVLVDVVVELGQRAVIGKVAMDQHSPGFYVDQGAGASLAGTRQVVAYIQVGLHRVRGPSAGDWRLWEAALGLRHVGRVASRALHHSNYSSTHVRCLPKGAPHSVFVSPAALMCLRCWCAPFCVQACGCERVVASVIPRFIPTCSQALLEGLGALAQQAELNLVVHSHISESRSG